MENLREVKEKYYDITREHAASLTDVTGAVPSLPSTSAESDAYSDLLGIPKAP